MEPALESVAFGMDNVNGGGVGIANGSAGCVGFVFGVGIISGAGRASNASVFGGARIIGGIGIVSGVESATICRVRLFSDAPVIRLAAPLALVLIAATILPAASNPTTLGSASLASSSLLSKGGGLSHFDALSRQKYCGRLSCMQLLASACHSFL